MSRHIFCLKAVKLRLIDCNYISNSQCVALGVVTDTGGRNRAVSKATSYRLDGSGFELQWGKTFSSLHPFWSLLWPTQPPIKRVPRLFTPIWGGGGNGVEVRGWLPNATSRRGYEWIVPDLLHNGPLCFRGIFNENLYLCQWRRRTPPPRR